MASRQTAVARGPAVAAGLPREAAGLPGAVPAPRRLDNALELDAVPCLSSLPPRGARGRHRRRYALARATDSAHPHTPSRGFADRYRSWMSAAVPLLPVPGAALRAALGFPQQGTSSTTVRGVARPAPSPLRAFLPPCKAAHCRAAGLPRQGPASLRTSGRRAVWPPARAMGRARRASVLADRGRRPCACRGTGGPRACQPRCGRALACSVVAACPHTPRRSLRSVVVRMVFYWPGCVRPGTGGGRVLLPLTASHGSGDHGRGRPLAAAGGCRLLRRFFFLLKTRKVILAGPRPGQASLRSVRQRTLDMACPPGLGQRRKEEEKEKMPQQPAAFAARGRTACFTPRRHGKIWRSGGSTGTRRCTAAAHSPQKNPLEEDR